LVIPKKYWFPILYVMAIAFFCVGCAIWLLAHVFQPDNPIPDPVRKINLGSGPEVYPLEHYQSLLSGRLFFGGSDLPFEGSEVQFHSRLILKGVIKDGQAVVGLDLNSNNDTRLVEVGDVIEGETIVTIGDVYIVVKNQTGQGKITINGEQHL